MTAEQKLDEQETTFTIEATNRNLLYVFSNDSVWIKRIEALGLQPYRQDGYGRWYKLDIKETFGLYLRKKPPVTDGQRERARIMYEAHVKGEKGTE